MNGQPIRDWDRILEVQRLLQQHFPELVLVRGTAAALHAEQRVSFDADHVAQLRERFDETLAQLEALAGRQSGRIAAPVMILGHFRGVETGIRQLRRQEPLETEVLEGIRLPTLAEMVRVKAWMVVTRNATRDYLDVCALADKAGESFAAAVAPRDRLYPQAGNETVTRQLCKQLAEPKPYDLRKADLRYYRGIRTPWDSWEYVRGYCRRLSAARRLVHHGRSVARRCFDHGRSDSGQGGY